MRIETLNSAYDILNKVFEDRFTIAIGGYYSLLKQNILKQTRGIGDLDVNILYAPNPLSKEGTIKCIRSCFNTISRINNSKDNYAIEVSAIIKSDYEDDEDNVDNNISDSSFSVNLSIKSKIRTDSIIFDRAKKTGYEMSAADIEAEIMRMRNPATNTMNDLSPGQYDWHVVFSQNNTTGETSDERQSPIPTPPHISPPDWLTYSYDGQTVTAFNGGTNYVDLRGHDSFTKIKAPFAINGSHLDTVEGIGVKRDLANLIMSAGGKLKIDFFLVEANDPSKIFVKKDGIYLSSYYQILKAKHLYCTKSYTPPISFDKHINDLRESYKTKRIRGVNYPEDIELLLTNWEEIKNEKNK